MKPSLSNTIAYYLSRVPTFRDYDKQKLLAIASRARSEIRRRKDILFIEGDEIEELCVVTDGCIEAVSYDASGAETVFGTLEKGGLIHLLDLATDGKCSASSICATEAVIIRLSKHDSLEFLSRAEVQRQIIETAQQQIRQLQRDLKRLANCSLQARLALYFRDLSAGATTTQEDHLSIRVTDSQPRIATKVCASRTRVNIALQKWVSNDEVRIEKQRVIIPSPDQFWRKYAPDPSYY